MKIKTQLIATMTLFGLILVAIAGTAIFTEQRLAIVSKDKSASVQLGIWTSELGYLANDYLIYGESQQLERWESKLGDFEAEVASLSAGAGTKQTLIENIGVNGKQMKEIFESIRDSRKTADAGENPVFDITLFRISWSRMTVQFQALMFDSTRLTTLLDVEQQNLTSQRTVLIYIMIGLFGVFLIVSYMFTYRRLFDSLRRLKAGTTVIGSGNLDYVIDEERRDEVGELSAAFNRMTRSLKNLTASKTELENEVAERIQVEAYLAQARDNLAYDLYAMTELKELAALLIRPGENQAIYDQILEAAIIITDGEMGDIVILDKDKNTFSLKSHTGMSTGLVDSLIKKYESEGNASIELQLRERLAVEDLMQAPVPEVARTLEVNLRAGIRAFQSTPIIKRDGKLVGVISTYFRKPHKLAERESNMLDLLALQAADMLGRIEIEEELARSEQKYRILFDSMTEGFALHEIICDKDSKPIDYMFIELNGAFERLTGLSHEKVVGKRVKEVIPGIEQFWIDTYGSVALAGQSVHFENYSEALKRHYDVIAYRPRPMQFAVIFMDITERKQNEGEQQITIDFLSLVNRSSSTRNLVQNVALFFRERSGCEAVGVRLRDGEDYPYYETRGFSPEFVASEMSLCSRDGQGRLTRDASGNPVIECMCGNVICGRFDPSKSFFTPHGSFWTNSTTELLASTTEEDREARTRNRCNGEGYESVALIPIHSGDDRVGLVQLNDKRKSMFTESSIRLWERLADYFAIGLAKFLAEDRLADSEKRFSTTLASIGDAVITTDVEGNVTFMNNVAEQITGWLFGDVTGSPAARVFRIVNENTREEAQSPIAKVLEEKTIVGLANHTLLIRKDGSEVQIDDSAAPIMDRDGNCIGVVLVFRDITLRRRAEEVIRRDKEATERLVTARTKELTEAYTELERAKRLSDIGTLAATVAHELRNPLASMSLAVSNIRRKANNPDIEKHLATIGKKIIESDLIINNLLYYSRIKPPHYGNVRISDLVRECVDNVYEQMKKEVVVETELDLIVNLCVEADQHQLREVFSNILNNALDATPDTGAKIRISANYSDSHVEVTIADNGCGIPVENIERVFDPFFTTKTKGTGLGLSVCKQIVALHGGSIDVRSTPGNGTSVIMRLPTRNNA